MTRIDYISSEFVAIASLWHGLCSLFIFPSCFNFKSKFARKDKIVVSSVLIVGRLSLFGPLLRVIPVTVNYSPHLTITVYNNHNSLTMADAAPAPVKKVKKVAKPAAHPPFKAMIATAVTALKERGGSSRQAILKYIVANNKVDADKAAVHLRLALKSGLAKGTLVKAKAAGKGAGKYKLGKVEKPKKAKKPKKAVKPKKPKAKKPAKKAVKKPAKKAAKKPAKKAVKKPAKKPAAKKPAKKAAKPKKAAPKKAAKKAAPKKK